MYITIPQEFEKFLLGLENVEFVFVHDTAYLHVSRHNGLISIEENKRFFSQNSKMFIMFPKKPKKT